MTLYELHKEFLNSLKNKKCLFENTEYIIESVGIESKSNGGISMYAMLTDKLGETREYAQFDEVELID